jgi:hypothetical protein
MTVVMIIGEIWVYLLCGYNTEGLTLYVTLIQLYHTSVFFTFL